MDVSAFKKHTTSRGYTYNYYCKAAEASKPTLVFLHGFPSSSYDWRHQIAFFQARGYGLIVPDMLGYAGTDKPTDPSAYVGSGLAKDVVDILDAEDIAKAIVVGHDWGSRVASRLVNFHPERVAALAFVALGYVQPNAGIDYATFCAAVKQMAGRDVFGYWEFFSSDGADKLIESRFDSFISTVFPHPPSLWVELLGPFGALEDWIQNDRRSPEPAYITEEDKKHYSKVLLGGGLAAPLCYYKVMTEGLEAEDVKSIPEGSAEVKQPVFFAACSQDAVCLSAHGKQSIAASVRGPVTTLDFDAGHWVLLSHAEELNTALLGWLVGLAD
ncbi:alpha/beta-hydrolase [Artomyces pyxidatus]|uniref:Alpha/beta-hydrolase n=1 Tax=Artomyces pyxidatus TaxID=48021 RepID=A0ACB8SVM8_9AGAM|nr:alpha/beta-hydrolase [Artomyces pyxidatus]